MNVIFENDLNTISWFRFVICLVSGLIFFYFEYTKKTDSTKYEHVDQRMPDRTSVSFQKSIKHSKKIYEKIRWKFWTNYALNRLMYNLSSHNSCKEAGVAT